MSAFDADLRTFAALVVKSAIYGATGVRAKARVLLPRGDPTAVGTSRHEIQLRMRKFWKTDWTYERVTAVVGELERRGVVVRRDAGLRLADADAIETLAKEEAAA